MFTCLGLLGLIAGVCTIAHGTWGPGEYLEKPLTVLSERNEVSYMPSLHILSVWLVFLHKIPAPHSIIAAEIVPGIKTVPYLLSRLAGLGGKRAIGSDLPILTDVASWRRH